jgi:subtilisin-like proprotein convertase family protein
MTRSLLFVLATLSASVLLAQAPAFQLRQPSPGSQAEVGGPHFRLLVDEGLLRRELSAKRATIRLPLPEGQFADFSTAYSPVFEAALASRYPQISSFVVDGPWGRGRIALSHRGISAFLYGPEGAYSIEPAQQDDGYLLYYAHELTATSDDLPLACGFNPSDPLNLSEMELDANLGADAGAKSIAKSSNEPRPLRQYDLALTNTGEFARKIGGAGVDKADVLAAWNTAVSTINVIFEREIGIRMNLLAISEDLIFLDPETDPFSDSDVGTGLLNQVVTAFEDAAIPATAYDLGHIFTARCNDVGGVVSGRACSGSKTRGVTCFSGNDLSRTARGIMAHEIAHQFSVSHSWNNCPRNQEQRAGNSAFEPGSGTTIMSYAGACGDQNIGPRDAYYHVGSLEQFLFFTQEGGAEDCATVMETDNLTPEVSLPYEDGFFIPRNTPFRLTGTATDANDPEEQLTYNWEQYDLGPPVDILNPEGEAPLFRSVPPTTDGNTRYFPRVDRVANGINAPDEILPEYSRDMNFRLTARDNNPEAGGVDWATVSFGVADVGPFLVNEPDLGDSVSWRVGELREVSWDPGGTTGFPVFADRVNILLSGDGGLTFTEVLAANVANNGSARVTVPDTLGSAMRIVIEASDNIFYNMNARDFRIEEAVRPTYTLISDLNYDNLCLPETVTATFTAGSVLGYDEPVNLAVDDTELPERLSATFDREQVLPGQTATLTLNLEEVNISGRVTVPVIVTAPGLDTSRREIILDVVSNDFDDLMLASPTEGTEGIVLTTDFDWTDAINAEAYDFQIATSASFAPATIFEEATELIGTEYTPEEFLEANQLYFWRVRPVNSCGPGPWAPVNTFRTISSQCDTYTYDDPAVGLPGSGGAFTRQANIFVDRRGTINDLNLPNVTVNYQFVSKITVSLTSPSNKTVVLYEENCFSTNSLNLGFDDDAPIAVVCPPDDKRVFQPKGTLADFIGEDTFGEWTLTVAVSETNGAAGSIAAWNIEFCADVEASLPQTLVNEATEVQPLGRNAVLRSELEINGAPTGPDSTVYILTRMPARGFLELRGAMLGLGDSFSQTDINAQRLVYESTDTSLLTDDFGFVVTTPQGGYLPLTYHDIVITNDAINANWEPSALQASLEVFPNPTQGDTWLRWSAVGSRDVSVELFDLNGRRLNVQRLPLGAGEARVPTANLPAGFYLLRMDGAVRRLVKR